MNEEKWKLITWIPDLPDDKYSISTWGRIRNEYTGKIRLNTTRKNGTVICIVSNSPRNASATKRMVHYHVISNAELKQYKTIHLTISIQVAKAFLPPPECVDDTMITYVGYKDDNISNVHVDNLEWRYRLTYDYKQSIKKAKVNRKLSDTTVRKICVMLLEEHGDLKRIRHRIVDELPSVSIEQVMSIKYKEHYQSISDEYFDYYDKKFIPLK